MKLQRVFAEKENHFLVKIACTHREVLLRIAETLDDESKLILLKNILPFYSNFEIVD